MKRVLILLAVVFLIANVSANCDDGQIDINSASKIELMKLHGIGDVKSQAIIDYRTNKFFKSIDDLDEVYGIGEVTLTNIKNQGLACVEYDEEDFEEEKQEDKPKENISEIADEETNFPPPEPVVLETINLAPQTIKSENNSEETGRNSTWIWIVVFVALVGFWFVLKKKKIEYKNEFKD